MYILYSYKLLPHYAFLAWGLIKQEVRLHGVVLS